MDHISKTTISIVIVLLLYILELIFPYMTTWKGKHRHALQNGLLTLFNILLTATLFSILLTWSTNNSWGVLYHSELPWILELVLTILILDGFTYTWHVLAHNVPFLWRFHKVHHSDTMMDVTTGGRFHIGEHLISFILKCIVIFLLGLEIQFIMIYEVAFTANVLFHHANVSMGERLDYLYSLLLTSPLMHKVHHSNIIRETNSNYSSLFSFWDRVFGTFSMVKDPQRIVVGIRGLEHAQSVTSMLSTPFKK